MPRFSISLESSRSRQVKKKARRLLASALVDMAETNLLLGEPLPRPDPGLTDPEADLEEPIHLLLTATSRVELVPQSVAS